MKGFSLKNKMKKLTKITIGVLMVLVISFVTIKPLFIGAEEELSYALKNAVFEERMLKDLSFFSGNTKYENVEEISINLNTDASLITLGEDDLLINIPQVNSFVDHESLDAILVDNGDSTYNLNIYTTGDTLYYYSLDSLLYGFASLNHADLSNLTSIDTLDEDDLITDETFGNLKTLYPYASYKSLFEGCSDLYDVNVTTLTRPTDDVSRMFYGTANLYKNAPETAPKFPDLTNIMPASTVENYNTWLADIATGSNVTLKGIVGSAPTYSNLLKIKFAGSSSDGSDLLMTKYGIAKNELYYNGVNQNAWDFTDFNSEVYSYSLSSDNGVLKNAGEQSTLTVNINSDDKYAFVTDSSHFNNIFKSATYVNKVMKGKYYVVVPNDFNDYENSTNLTNYVNSMSNQAILSYGTGEDLDLTGDYWDSIGFTFEIVLKIGEPVGGLRYIYPERDECIKIYDENSTDVSSNFNLGDMIERTKYPVLSAETGEPVVFNYLESRVVAKPTISVCKEVSYNGESQVVINEPAEHPGYVFTNKEGVYGNVEVVAELESGYKWADNSIQNVTFTCPITNVKADVPTCSGTYQDASGGNVAMLNPLPSGVTQANTSMSQNQKDIDLAGYAYQFVYTTDGYDGFKETDDPNWDSEEYTLTCPLDYAPEYRIDYPEPNYEEVPEYTGSRIEIFPTPDADSGYTWYQSSGNLIDVNTYTWVAKLSTGYRWNVDTDYLSDYSLSAQIKKAKINVPDCNMVTASDGVEDEHHVVWYELVTPQIGKFTVSPNNGKANVTTEVTYTLSLEDTNNYEWNVEENTLDDQELICSVGEAKVDKPSIETLTYTYDGESHTLIPTVYQSNSGYTFELKKNNETVSDIYYSAIDAGNYTYTAKLNTGFKWKDDSSNDVVFNITINKKSIEIPTKTVETFVYTGESQKLVSDPTEYYTYVSGEGLTTQVSQTNAGTYRYRAELVDAENTAFVDTENAYYEIEVVIAKKVLNSNLPNVSFADNKTTYNGENQVLLNNSSSSDWQLSVDSDSLEQKNVGTYHYKVELLDPTNTKFENIDESYMEFTVSIDKKVIALPIYVNKKTYTGEALTLLNVLATDEWEITNEVNPVQTNAGTYSYIITVKDLLNTKFEDETTSNTISITVDPIKVTMPTNLSLTYNGTEQDLFEGITELITATGDIKATDAGSYTTTFALVDKTNYVWTNETNANISLTTTIAKKVIDLPSCKLNVEYVDDETDYDLINGYDVDAIILKDENDEVVSNIRKWNGTGKYIYKAVLSNDTNYEWAEENTGIIELGTCKVLREGELKVAALQTYSNKVFNGTEQQLLQLPEENAGYKLYSTSELIESSDDLKGLLVGTYTFLARLDTGYKWDDLSQNDQTIEIEITKSALDVSLTSIDNIARENNTAELIKGVVNTLTGSMTKAYQDLGYSIVITDYDVIFTNESDYTEGGLFRAKTYKVMKQDVDYTSNFNTINPTGGKFTYAQAPSEKTKVTLPNKDLICRSDAIYNGESQSLIKEEIDESKYTISAENQVLPGTYTVTATLKDPDTYEWSGHTGNTYNFTCDLLPYKIDKPLLKDNVTYSKDPYDFIDRSEYYDAVIFGYRSNGNEYDDKDDKEPLFVYVDLTLKPGYAWNNNENSQELNESIKTGEDYDENGINFMDIPKNVLRLRNHANLKNMSVNFKNQTILTGKVLHSSLDFVEGTDGMLTGDRVAEISLWPKPINENGTLYVNKYNEVPEGTGSYDKDPDFPIYIYNSDTTGNYEKDENSKDYVQSVTIMGEFNGVEVDVTAFYNIGYSEFQVTITDDEENENLVDDTLNKSDYQAVNICRNNSQKIGEKGLVYSGYNQTLTDTNGFVHFDNNVGIDAGNYTVKVYPNSGYIWDDGTLDPIDVVCTIVKKEITVKAKDQKVVSGKEINKSIEYIDDPLTGNEYVGEITLTLDGNNIVPSNAVIYRDSEEDMVDVTKNYTITYENGTYTVKESTGTIEMDTEDIKVDSEFITLFDVNTVEGLKSLIEEEYSDTGTYVHLDRNRNTKDTNVLATGDYIVIGDDEYQVVIRGDINCDGKIGSKDLAAVIRSLLAEEGEPDKITDSLLIKAGDYNNDNLIKSADMAKIIEYMMR